MDPANTDEAIHEVALDLQGRGRYGYGQTGDALPRHCSQTHDGFHVPVAVYQVSGEYAMLKAAAERGWLDEKKVVLESLLSMKRAGACAILTYFAYDVAKWLTESSK